MHQRFSTAKDELFDVIFEAAKKLNVFPDWLKEKREPQCNFDKYGSAGPNLVLLHGLFGHLSNWRQVIPKLQSVASIYALQFPLLEAKKSEVSVQSLTLFVLFFILRNNLAPCFICGNSLGGHVALRVALLMPQLVKGLILAGPSGLYEHTVDSLPVRPDKNFIREHMRRVFYDPCHVTDEYVDEIYEILSRKENVKNLVVSAKSAKRDNLYDELVNVKVPVLLLWGENDQITSLDVGAVFASRIKDAKLVSKEKCGHAPMIEEPEWFSEQIKRFLAEQTQNNR